MKVKMTTLLLIKPLVILALVFAFKPSGEIAKTETMTDEVQSMRGYFLEDQSMKLVITHKRVQILKGKILQSSNDIITKHKTKFVKMVKDFNLAIAEFEKLTEYKSKNWNESRKKFIVLMKNVEDQQMNLHQILSQRKMVSI
ncbi:hypothetical protein BIY24_12280 [Halobacteriovorax marinus]|uniref:Membrane protein n=1 Tax=Halobacteriovorax marinus (strain ATCC BAA-682 / DSM 15412 / SJ) TaxID=862908 RepID=E1X651_HALMS|nr:hypothetical protein [Halobacteriovorax marinus]ATH08696.1 hypothetical protein BIY24_12280 [Halobacteriovorax marinus]CBW27395.1 putative membrane protein [Halobacteriovorax marinus SJ]